MKRLALATLVAALSLAAAPPIPPGPIVPVPIPNSKLANSSLSIGGQSVSLGGALANIPVAGGGTGLSALMAHAALLGNGTSAVTPLAGCTNGVMYWTLATVDPTCAATVTLGGNITAGTISAMASYRLNVGLFASVTLPAIASGFGTSPTAPTSSTANGSLAFPVIVGTGGTATTGQLTMPTALHGWICTVIDQTSRSATVANTYQTASSTTSVTVGNYSNSMASAPWAAGDTLLFTCVGY